MSHEGSEDAIARAQMLAASGELTAASYVLDRHLRLHPDDGAALLQLAQVLAQQGDLGAAERTAGDALSDDETVPWARATLAQIIGHDPARVVEAADLARDAVRERGNNAGLRIVYATMLGRAGRTEDALAEIDAAFMLAPGDVFVRSHLHAHAARALADAPGGAEEALEHARRAVDLDPTDEDAVRLLQLLQARRSR